MPVPDWMYHPIGAALALFGGLWLLWALFLSGRAKGKPRCPKCWYDMTGAQGLTCPECGKTPKSPRGLLKTRRKYVQALASLLVLLLAYSAWQTPRIKRYGWPCALPNWALIALFPIFHPPQKALTFPDRGSLRTELFHRMDRDRLTQLDRIAVSWIARCWLDPSRAYHEQDEAMRLLIESATADQSTVDRLIELASQKDIDLRALALRTLGATAIQDTRVQSLILAALRETRQIRFVDLFAIPRTQSACRAWTILAADLLKTSQELFDRAEIAWELHRLGTAAADLLPLLHALRNECAVRNHESYLLQIDATIAVLSGQAGSASEYFALRLPSSISQSEFDTLCRFLGFDQRPYAPETVTTLARVLDSVADAHRIVALLHNIDFGRPECRQLLPPLRRAAERVPMTSALKSRLHDEIDHLEYPW